MTQEVTSMAGIKMPAVRSKAQEITFEETFHIFLTDSAVHAPAKKARMSSPRRSLIVFSSIICYIK